METGQWMFLLTSFFMTLLLVLIFKRKHLINKLLFDIIFYKKKVAVLDF